MQRAFQKMAFIGLVSLSSVFAADADLLSQVTGGTATVENAKAYALSQNEMQDVKGGTVYVNYRGIGSIYYNANTRAVSSPVTIHSAIYASTWGSYYWGRTWH